MKKCTLCPRTILPGQPSININEEISICYECMVNGIQSKASEKLRVQALAVGTFQLANWRVDVERALRSRFLVNGFYQVGTLLIALGALAVAVLK